MSMEGTWHISDVHFNLHPLGSDLFGQLCTAELILKGRICPLRTKPKALVLLDVSGLVELFNEQGLLVCLGQFDLADFESQKTTEPEPGPNGDDGLESQLFSLLIITRDYQPSWAPDSLLLRKDYGSTVRSAESA